MKNNFVTASYRLKDIAKKILLIGASLLLMVSLQIKAQQTPEEAPSINQLLMKIEERDQMILDLQKRVKQLEQRIGSEQLFRESAETAPTAAESTARPESDTGTAAQQTAEDQTTAAAAESPEEAAPGSFEVDEDAAERALERTLVQTGAMLLPFGKAEIQPFVSYSRIENQQPALLSSNALTNLQRRQNVVDAGVLFRLGLPFETQAELSIPTRIINRSDVVIGGGNLNGGTDYALGDIRLGLAKTLLREGNWIPDVVGRITWDTDSGKQADIGQFRALRGNGFNELTFSVTALKRQDPLAFTGSMAYSKAFKKNGINPGDRYQFSLGATLAASPQTSLSLGILQSFSDHAKVSGNSVPGTDIVSSFVTLGASSIIGKRLFFTTLAGVGLTNNSPDYFLNIAVPFRFDVPFRSMFKTE